MDANYLNIYPEPDDMIRFQRENYIIYKRAMKDLNHYSTDAGLKKMGQDLVDEMRLLDRKLVSLGYTVDYIDAGRVIHWRVCAWREGELLRPWLLDRANPADREYIENWRNYAAPELLNSRFDWPSPPREDDKQRYGYRDEIIKQTRGIG